jgi:hypothetical protein
MIGKIILGTYIALEMGLHIIFWGKLKPQLKVGIKTILEFMLDFGIITAGILLW